MEHREKQDSASQPRFIFSVGVVPLFSCFHKSRITMDADVLQRLLVFAIFVARVVEKGLNGLAVVVFCAVPAGDMAFGQTAFLHFALCPAEIPGAVQIPRFVPLAGF